MCTGLSTSIHTCSIHAACFIQGHFHFWPKLARQFSFLKTCLLSINHLHTLMTNERFVDDGGGPSNFVISENLFLSQRQRCPSCIFSIVQNTREPPLCCVQNVWRWYCAGQCWGSIVSKTIVNLSRVTDCFPTTIFQFVLFHTSVHRRSTPGPTWRPTKWGTWIRAVLGHGFRLRGGAWIFWQVLTLMLILDSFSKTLVWFFLRASNLHGTMLRKWYVWFRRHVLCATVRRVGWWGWWGGWLLCRV